MKKVLFLVLSIFILTNIVYPQDIINETGAEGKFIVRDVEQQEALIVEDGNVGITGELQVGKMPFGVSGSPYVVWDKEDNKFKIMEPFVSTESGLHQPLLDINAPMATAYHDLGDNGWARAVEPGINETRLMGSGLRMSNLYSSGGWARSLLKYTNSAYADYFSIGGRGDGQSFQYAFIGPSFDHPWQVWRSGNVGIGDFYTPSVKLHVVGNHGQGYPVYTAGTMFAAQQNTSGNWAHMAITGASNAVASLNFGDYLDDDAGRVRYFNSDNSMRLGTNGGEKVRITSAGNVGIGTTNPVNKLHLYDAGNYGDLWIEDIFPFVWFDASVGGNQGLGFQEGDGNYKGWIYHHGATDGITISGRNLGYPQGDLFAANDGNIGINTTAPAAKLDVEGDVILGASGSRFMEIREISGTTGATGNYLDITDGLPSGWIAEKTRILSIEVQYGGADYPWYSNGWYQEGYGYAVGMKMVANSRDIRIYWPNYPLFNSQSWRAMIMRMP